jgi:hypothetical protein
MSRSTTRTTLFLTVPVVLFLIGMLALPWVLNRPAIAEAFSREFEQRTGLRLSIEAWRVGLFPSITLALQQAQVRDPAAATPLFVADRMDIAIQWLPLLAGKVVAKDLIIDRPRLTMRRAADGTWALAGANPASSSDDATEPMSLLQMVRNVLIVDGMITVIDESAVHPRIPLHLEVAQGTLSTEMRGRHAKLHISGTIPQDQDRAAFVWDGSLTQSPERGGVQAEGDLRLRHIDARYMMSSWAGIDPLSSGLSGPAELTAHLRWLSTREGSELIADEWRARLGDFAMQGTAAVSGLESTAPTFSVVLSASPLTVARALNQIPTAWFPAQLRTQFVEHEVDGLITVPAMSLSGSLTAGSRPTISGQLQIREGRMTVDPQYPPLEALSASISYDAALLTIKDLHAQCGPVRLVGNEVVVTEWMTRPRVDTNISASAPVAATLDAIRRIDDLAHLQDMLAQMEQVTGDLELIAHVAGQPTDGKPMTLVGADLMVHRGGFRSASLPEPVRQVEARIRAASAIMVIERLDGWLGPASVHAQGAVNWMGGKAYSNVKVDVEVDASDVRELFAKDIDGGFHPEMEGTIRLHAALTGPLEASRLKGNVDFQQAALRIPNRFIKPLQAPAMIEFDSRLADGTRVVIPRLSLEFPAVKIIGDGSIDLTGDREFAFNVSSRAVSVSQLPQGVELGPIRAGTFGATLHVEGRMKDRASWRTSGEIRFDDGSVVVESLQEPIQEAFITLRFDQDRIQIPRMTFHIGASDVRISGSIAQWADQPRVRLVVESSQIDVAAFVTSGSSGRRDPRSAQHRSRGNAWWSDVTLNAFVFADHVYYKKFLLTDLSTKVIWDHGLLTVERISGDTNEGHIAGQVKMRASGHRIEQARSVFRASGIPVDRVLSLVQEKPSLSGWLTTSGKLQGEFERAGLTVGSLTSRQPIQILIEGGRIHHLPVFSTLLSVMNLPAVLQGQVDFDKDGLPLDRLKLVFSLNSGAVNIKELLLDSPVLKVSGTGRYDIVADEFDMVLATSPLGSYSAMLKRIPLFGHLLAGDRQGFDTAVFELKGSANRPNLRYLPRESLMTGVTGTAQLAFDILVNAITLPQKAYSMVDGGVASGEDEDF